MAYSRRYGIDKALDQVDRVLENLGQKQNERKNQENKSVQCHSSENLAKHKYITTKENVKLSKIPRGVLLPRRAVKPGQIKQDTFSRNNRAVEDSTHEILSSTPNTSKITTKNSHNFTSISHISNIALQHKKRIKRKRIQRVKENSSTDEEISRSYSHKNENNTSKKTSTKIKKMKSNSMRYIEKENKKQSNQEKEAPSESSKSRISTHAEPTQSSIHRMLLTEKIQKQQDNILPYVPVGKKSISHNCGVKIQQDLGKLKLDPKGASIEAKYLTKQNSEKNINTGSIKNHCMKKENKETPQLCEAEIYRALKNINKEISEFIVQSS